MAEDDRVRSLQFHSDGSVVIEFTLPQDDKANGALMNRAVAIPPDTLAMDALEMTRAGAERALSEVMQRWGQLRERPRPDEGPGYDNPTERDDVRDYGDRDPTTE